jgi:hypothetical protein
VSGVVSRAVSPVNPAPHVSRSVTGPVLGLLAIPLASVSTAVLLGDVASSPDRLGLVCGLVATVVGTAMGLVVVSVTRAGAVAFGSVAAALTRWSSLGSGSVLVPLPMPIGAPVVVVPVTAAHRASIRRRGPPVVLG